PAHSSECLSYHCLSRTAHLQVGRHLGAHWQLVGSMNHTCDRGDRTRISVACRWLSLEVVSALLAGHPPLPLQLLPRCACSGPLVGDSVFRSWGRPRRGDRVSSIHTGADFT